MLLENITSSLERLFDECQRVRQWHLILLLQMRYASKSVCSLRFVYTGKWMWLFLMLKCSCRRWVLANSRSFIRLQTNLKDPINHSLWSQKILDISLDFFCSVGLFGSENRQIWCIIHGIKQNLILCYLPPKHWRWKTMGFNCSCLEHGWYQIVCKLMAGPSHHFTVWFLFPGLFHITYLQTLDIQYFLYMECLYLHACVI